MKKKLWILLLPWFILPAMAQTDNTVYVKAYMKPGYTVGMATTLAQSACASGIACVVIFDPSLALYPSGTMPAQCANCTWADYRSPGVFNAAPLKFGSLSAGIADGTANAGACGWSTPPAWCSGSDVFAWANAAETQAQTVLIPPGTYSVSSTLRCANGATIVASGVTADYTGTAAAFDCANAQNVALLGPMLVLGPGQSGSTVGMTFGIGSGGNGTVTTYNRVQNVTFSNFHVGCVLDGSPGNNGTYTNTFDSVYCNGNGIGWSLKPTVANYANANTFPGCAAIGNAGDGWVIDGSNGNTLSGTRSELNGGYGYDFTGISATNSETIVGGWSEANTAGDVNFANSTNVTKISIQGLVGDSGVNVAGDPSGAGNSLHFGLSSGRFIDWYGAPVTYHITPALGTNFGFTLENDETPPSGIVDVVGLYRSATNSGALYLGTPEYPATFRAPVALPGASTAVTQASADNTTDVATNAFVQNVVGQGVKMSGEIPTYATCGGTTACGALPGTQLGSIAIPAGTLSSNGDLSIEVFSGACTAASTPYSNCAAANTANCQFQLYLSTTSTGTTTSVGLISNGIAVNGFLLGDIKAQGSTSSERVNSFEIRNGSTASVLYSGALSLNFGTTQYYLNIFGVDSTTADVCGIEQARVVPYY